MSVPRYARKAAVIVTFGLALTACTKPEEPATPAIPAGNAQAPMSAADCDRLVDPTPSDDSPTGKATAVSQGMAARAACKRAASAPHGQSNEDLARMRQIMEKQEAERNGRKISDEEWARRVKEAGKKPPKEYHY